MVEPEDVQSWTRTIQITEPDDAPPNDDVGSSGRLLSRSTLQNPFISTFVTGEI